MNRKWIFLKGYALEPASFSSLVSNIRNPKNLIKEKDILKDKDTGKINQYQEKKQRGICWLNFKVI